METNKEETLFYAALPAKLKVPKNVLESGDILSFDEIRIYTGSRPNNLSEAPSGRLLCKVAMGKSALMLATGTAGCYILLKNKRPVYIGTAGTSGCGLDLATTAFKKGGLFITKKAPAYLRIPMEYRTNIQAYIAATA